MIFADTSAVAKLYVPEAESAAVGKLFDGTEAAAVSELVRVELMAVFHRRLREGRWGRADFQTAVRQFQQDDLGGFWTWLPLDAAILNAAAQAYATLPETVFVRSSDCVHLVTALHHNFPEVYTYDRHQTLAAPALGLKPVQA
ncbi:MAG TPA: type II toxin-antitoxin system VapC family toxin [Opitutaceae bacterium]